MFLPLLKQFMGVPGVGTWVCERATAAGSLGQAIFLRDAAPQATIVDAHSTPMMADQPNYAALLPSVSQTWRADIARWLAYDLPKPVF